MPDVSPSQDTVLEYFPRTLLEKHQLSFECYDRDASSDVASAEINWVPNLSRFSERTTLASRKPYSDSHLPTNWPETVRSPLVWSGSELREEEYIFEISDANRQEIEHATKEFLGKFPETCLQLWRDSTSDPGSLQQPAWIWSMSIKRLSTFLNLGLFLNGSASMYMKDVGFL